MTKSINRYSRALWLAIGTAVLSAMTATDLSSAQAVGTGAPASTDRAPFLVFDGTVYRNKPDLARYGIRPMHIIYAGRFWPDKSQMHRLPDREAVHMLAREASRRGDTTVIDIEHWPLRGEEGAIQASIAKYTQIVRWFREEAPNLKIGYYGAPPIRDYWRATSTSQTKQGEWQAENDRLGSLAKELDILFPSLYTFYADRDGWVKYGIAQIREARRYGKPVYVFLWPEYHNSNRLLRGSYLDGAYWRLQLETALAHADGIVIWGGAGSTGPVDWDESAPWWQETRRFMERLRSAGRSPVR